MSWPSASHRSPPIAPNQLEIEAINSACRSLRNTYRLLITIMAVALLVITSARKNTVARAIAPYLTNAQRALEMHGQLTPEDRIHIAVALHRGTVASTRVEYPERGVPSDLLFYRGLSGRELTPSILARNASARWPMWIDVIPCPLDVELPLHMGEANPIQLGITGRAPLHLTVSRLDRLLDVRTKIELRHAPAPDDRIATPQSYIEAVISDAFDGKLMIACVARVPNQRPLRLPSYRVTCFHREIPSLHASFRVTINYRLAVMVSVNEYLSAILGVPIEAPSWQLQSLYASAGVDPTMPLALAAERAADEATRTSEVVGVLGYNIPANHLISIITILTASCLALIWFYARYYARLPNTLGYSSPCLIIMTGWLALVLRTTTVAIAPTLTFAAVVFALMSADISTHGNWQYAVLAGLPVLSVATMLALEACAERSRERPPTRPTPPAPITPSLDLTATSTPRSRAGRLRRLRYKR